MKKIATVFTAILLAAAMLLPQAMLADQGAVFTMNGTDNVPAGGTFDVTLSVSGEYAIHAAHLSVEYDPNSLELVGLEELDVMKNLRSGNNLVILDYETLAYQGKIKLGIGMPTDAMNAKGDIFKMTFKVKDGVSVNQQIVMIVNEFVNAPVGGESTPQAFTTHNAIITISGAKDPEGGFNRGEEAVGDNKTSAPNYQPTETKQPAESGDPTGSTTPEPGADSTKAPDTKPNDNTKTPSNSGGEKTPVKVWPFIAAGGVVFLGAAAGVAVALSKKKKNSEDN